MRTLIIFHCAIPSNSLGITFSVVLCASAQKSFYWNPPIATNTTIIINTEFVRTRFVFAQDDEHGRTPLSLGVYCWMISHWVKREIENNKVRKQAGCVSVRYAHNHSREVYSWILPVPELLKVLYDIRYRARCCYKFFTPLAQYPGHGMPVQNTRVRVRYAYNLLIPTYPDELLGVLFNIINKTSICSIAFVTLSVQVLIECR